MVSTLAHNLETNTKYLKDDVHTVLQSISGSGRAEALAEVHAQQSEQEFCTHGNYN
jgi:hypothetical protein